MIPSATTPSQVRLGIPRHLQDCNGYCGPACVMMVHSGSSSEVESQHQMFRRVREHARQANDRRPVKSPAESLLTLLNTRGGKWEKLFRREPAPVAARIVQAVEKEGQPCLLLISKGMHWVVAFGRTLRDDGTVAGVLMRDPAWAGMPKFFGLTTMPEKPTFRHTAADPCPCLASNNPPGSVHERYIALEELLSPRGLQGSPDWEGKGALALVPVVSEKPAAAVIPASSAGPTAQATNPRTAALQEARAHGLHARPDWKQVLDGGQPGEPLLVKDPADPRDDFYLVPVHSSDAALRRTAWIMLDPSTLRLREASLLNDWTAPAFPTDEEAVDVANHDVTLPDGTRHRFKKSELKPNQRNLVWQASAASILPYWPVKEFTAPHPVTGEQVSVYMTQHGEVCSLSPVDTQPAASPQNSPPPPRAKPGGLSVLTAIVGVAAGLGIAALRKEPPPITDPSPPSVIDALKRDLESVKKEARDLSEKLDKEKASGAAAIRSVEEKWEKTAKDLRHANEVDVKALRSQLDGEQKGRLKAEEEMRALRNQMEELKRSYDAAMKKAEVLGTQLALEKERAAAAVKDVKRLTDGLAREEKLRAKAEEDLKLLRDQLEELKKSYATAVGKAAALEADLAREKERAAAAVKDVKRLTDDLAREQKNRAKAEEQVKQLQDTLEKLRRETKGNTGVIDPKPDPRPRP